MQVVWILLRMYLWIHNSMSHIPFSSTCRNILVAFGLTTHWYFCSEVDISFATHKQYFWLIPAKILWEATIDQRQSRFGLQVESTNCFSRTSLIKWMGTAQVHTYPSSTSHLFQWSFRNRCSWQHTRNGSIQDEKMFLTYHAQQFQCSFINKLFTL